MSIIKINTTLISMVILLNRCVTQRNKASSTISITTGTILIVTTIFHTSIHQHSHQKMVTLTKPKKQQVKQNVIQSVFSEKEFDQFHDYHQISRVTGIPVSTIMKIAAKVGFRDKKFRDIVELLRTERIL